MGNFLHLLLTQKFIKKTFFNSRSGASRQCTSEAHALHKLLTELPILCARCKHSMADTRLHPCKHKVVCVDCSFKCHVCPLCKVPVSNRCNRSKYFEVDINYCIKLLKVFFGFFLFLIRVSRFSKYKLRMFNKNLNRLFNISNTDYVAEGRIQTDPCFVQ